MFFIGGFGSVIPYLLYLSLIWIFILIGFKGNILPSTVSIPGFNVLFSQSTGVNYAECAIAFEEALEEYSIAEQTERPQEAQVEFTIADGIYILTNPKESLFTEEAIRTYCLRGPPASA